MTSMAAAECYIISFEMMLAVYYRMRNRSLDVNLEMKAVTQPQWRHAQYFSLRKGLSKRLIYCHLYISLVVRWRLSTFYFSIGDTLTQPRHALSGQHDQSNTIEIRASYARDDEKQVDALQHVKYDSVSNGE